MIAPNEKFLTAKTKSFVKIPRVQPLLRRQGPNETVSTLNAAALPEILNTYLTEKA